MERPQSSYGYGLGVIPDYHGVTIIQHGGGRKGISANVTVVPEAGFTGAALANLAGVPVATVPLAALNGGLGLPVATPVGEFADAECPPERLAAYTGVYRSGEGVRIVVTAEEGALVCTFENKRHIARPVGAGAFTLATPSGEICTRFLMRDDAAWGMSMGSRIVPRQGENHRLPSTPSAA